MHIAVCDDNIGDRRQLERLLKRESDRRASATGVFYTDSYGSVEAVMKSPMLYDVFFVDMVSGGTDGAALARLLLKSGVRAPVVLCVSSIDYRSLFSPDSADSPENTSGILFLDKPVSKEALSSALDRIIARQSQTVSAIELRSEKETRYVTEDDIVFAKAQDMCMMVYLKDGSRLSVPGSIDSFYAQLAGYAHYAAVSRTSMVNVSFLQKVSLTRLVLTDGTVLRTSPSYSGDIKKALQQLAEEL